VILFQVLESIKTRADRSLRRNRQNNLGVFSIRKHRVKKCTFRASAQETGVGTGRSTQALEYWPTLSKGGLRFDEKQHIAQHRGCSDQD